MQYKYLFSPMKIGNIEIKNRVVMPPMMLGHGQFNGKPTDQMIDYYEERAKGGVGLIITEITRVDDVTGVGAFAQLSVSHDYHIEPLKKLVDKIHSHNCKIFVQLHHPGRQNIPITVGILPMAIGLEKFVPKFRDAFYKMTPLAKKMQEKGIVLSVVGPSKTPPCRFAKGRNRALRHAEIKKLIKKFIDGAVRVKKSGADGVELHAAHGYLIQQFLCPLTNHRKDEYGGSLENRMRFLIEIIEGIKISCGQDFPIMVRLSVDECYDKIGEKKGYSLQEGVEIAKRLEKAGVAAIDVSSASYETMNYWLEPVTFELGWRKYMAQAVKKEVSIPVIAANLIRSAKQAEEQIEDGYQDLVALGRPLISDPYWAKKVMENREHEVKRCMCCLWCFESMLENAYKGTSGECAVNPRMGNEREFLNLNKNGNHRTVVIVGAGPAGLTAAEILSERGFNVIVYEKNSFVGGQVRLGSVPPNKEKISWCYDDLAFAAQKNGVKILFNTEATEKNICEHNPYAVIIATGAVALKPKSIKGIDNKNACTITEILNGTVVLKDKRVAVIGSGMSGLETAEKLCKDGNYVTVIEMAVKISPSTYIQHVDDIMPRLKEYDTTFIVGHRLESINSDSIIIENMTTKAKQSLLTDYVVLSLGSRPENDLYKSLEGKCDNLFIIGDADKIGRIAQATKNASRLAINLN